MIESAEKGEIQLRGVSVVVQSSTGLLEILRTERFEIGSGEQVVLFGPSGSGKSTLLHLVGGLLRARTGSIRVCGQNLETLEESALDLFRARNVGLIFQTFNLLPALTALENVLLGMRISGTPYDSAKALDLMKEVGLENRLDHFPATLSVGEQQRVALARALVHEPQLVLADEPTGALDRKRAGEMVDLMTGLARRRKSTLLVISHDPAIVERFPRQENIAGINLASGGQEGSR